MFSRVRTVLMLTTVGALACAANAGPAAAVDAPYSSFSVPSNLRVVSATGSRSFNWSLGASANVANISLVRRVKPDKLGFTLRLNGDVTGRASQGADLWCNYSYKADAIGLGFSVVFRPQFGGKVLLGANFGNPDGLKISPLMEAQCGQYLPLDFVGGLETASGARYPDTSKCAGYSDCRTIPRAWLKRRNLTLTFKENITYPFGEETKTYVSTLTVKLKRV